MDQKDGNSNNLRVRPHCTDIIADRREYGTGNRRAFRPPDYCNLVFAPYYQFVISYTLLPTNRSDASNKIALLHEMVFLGYRRHKSAAAISVVPTGPTSMQYESLPLSSATVGQNATQITYATSQYIFVRLPLILSLLQRSSSSNLVGVAVNLTPHQLLTNGNIMTLKISHCAFDGMCSEFHGWRCDVARAAGYGIEETWDGGCIVLPWDAISDDNIVGVWTTPPTDPLLVLLAHSDMAGKISPADGLRLADRLYELLIPAKWRNVTEKFVAACRLAGHRNEAMEFVWSGGYGAAAHRGAPA